MFYFYNFEPSVMPNYYIVNNIEQLTINHQNKGIKRSLISKDFALNFIQKYILY